MIIREDGVDVFKNFTDLLVMVIIFISVYSTNKQHSIVIININFIKQHCTVLPPPANSYDTRHVFTTSNMNLGSA